MWSSVISVTATPARQMYEIDGNDVDDLREEGQTSHEEEVAVAAAARADSKPVGPLPRGPISTSTTGSVSHLTSVGRGAKVLASKPGDCASGSRASAFLASTLLYLPL